MRRNRGKSQKVLQRKKSEKPKLWHIIAASGDGQEPRQRLVSEERIEATVGRVAHPKMVPSGPEWGADGRTTTVPRGPCIIPGSDWLPTSRPIWRHISAEVAQVGYTCKYLASSWALIKVKWWNESRTCNKVDNRQEASTRRQPRASISVPNLRTSNPIRHGAGWKSKKSHHLLERCTWYLIARWSIESMTTQIICSFTIKGCIWKGKCKI